MKSKNQIIYSSILSQIKSGVLLTGEILPSTRELAKRHHCHRFTVMKAFQDLGAEGWVEVTEKSRYRVSKKIPMIGSIRSDAAKVTHDLSKVIPPSPKFDLERERFQIEFWGGQPDLRLFPKAEFQRTLSSALRRSKADLLNYGMTDGLPQCLKVTAKYFRRSRNLLDKEFVMTNGSQEALLLCCQTFAKAGDFVIVEKKGYPPAWRLFESLGLKIIPIDVDGEGLDTNQLETVLLKRKVKFIYVTPLHQYPTTVSLSPRRRQHLLKLSDDYSIPILEDDYDHEFHYTAQPPPPISCDTDLGVYISSFSKILFPGIRLGAIGCHREIKEHICYHKYLVSRQTDSLSQIAFAAWVADGGFERHLGRMRRTYEKRYEFMLKELQKLAERTNINWVNPNGGMSIWVNLNRDSETIAKQAREKSVLFQFEKTMDYKGDKGSHLRIGFAGVDENQITEGLAVLGKLLTK
jgi:GntR family transcriptional regulator/MocR family aminotransferase